MPLSPGTRIVEFETLDHRVNRIEYRFFLAGIRKNVVAYEFHVVASFNENNILRQYKLFRYDCSHVPWLLIPKI